MFLTLPAPRTVTERFVMVLEGLYRAVAARSALSVLAGRGTEVLAGWLIAQVCHRVRRVEGRIARMLARFEAGRLRVCTTKPGAGTRVGPARVTRAVGKRPRGEGNLPRRFAWLLPLVPCDAANYASQLRLALAEPEMVALLRAAPQARRVLAPLCRMLGVEAELLAPKPAIATGSEALADDATEAPRPEGGRLPSQWWARMDLLMARRDSPGGERAPPDG